VEPWCRCSEFGERELRERRRRNRRNGTRTIGERGGWIKESDVGWPTCPALSGDGGGERAKRVRSMWAAPAGCSWLQLPGRREGCCLKPSLDASRVLSLSLSLHLSLPSLRISGTTENHNT
jgi:hypothetical protein